ncbi:MAG: hypothetical protein H0X34_07175 [Chthoniobacterales bacterium]|nr:hypothetical protein [Chthoniobacterales bacterium]
MADIPLGRADYHRTVAREARVQTLNRFFEQNPVLVKALTALISRPALRRWLAVGEGPIRGVYSQPGSFSDALFVVSGIEWYRIDKTGVTTLLTGDLLPGTGNVSMAGTGTIGTGSTAVPEFMYLADGHNLWLYTEKGFAKGTIAGSPAAGDVIRVGSMYYQFTAGSVDAGAPAGTVGNPWLIKHSFSVPLSWQHFAWALGSGGIPGTDYSTALTENPDARTSTVDLAAVTIRAHVSGVAGNAVTTTETGAGIAWGTGTLTGGGAGNVTIVETPDDVGPISVGYCASYVVVIPAQGKGINGRFWWINPGETTIDPLDFATAERAPDPVFAVVVFGDQFWLPGSNTAEVWYFTGNIDSPVLRLQGVTFDRGTWAGAAIAVKESMIIVDSDGGVFQISGGLKRISNPSIEERIRKSIAYQASRGL